MTAYDAMPLTCYFKTILCHQNEKVEKKNIFGRTAVNFVQSEINRLSQENFRKCPNSVRTAEFLRKASEKTCQKVVYSKLWSEITHSLIPIGHRAPRPFPTSPYTIRALELESHWP